jgi:hypothetical protein
MGSLVVGLIVVLGIAIGVQAAPLDLKHVSEDAAWLCHVDLDAVRASTVVQKAMEKHKNDARMAMCGKMLGMDLKKDLHGMTFYGKEIGKHKGVMILHAKVNQDRIMAMAKMLPNRQVTAHGDHQLHCWTHKSRHSSKTRTVAGAFYGDETIVMASSVDELKLAVDVLDGKAPSLTEHSALAGNVPPGTTMLMRVEGVSEADLPDKCKLAKQTKSFRFVTGEHDGESFYRSRSEMTNEEIVGQLKEILEGLRALGYIHVGDNEVGKNMVDAFRIKADGTTLTVLWKAPADDVWAMIEAHKKIFEEKMKKHRQRHGWGGHHRWHHRGGYKKAEPKKKDVPPEEDF